jgi:hypothetical protein
MSNPIRFNFLKKFYFADPNTSDYIRSQNNDPIYLNFFDYSIIFLAFIAVARVGLGSFLLGIKYGGILGGGYIGLCFGLSKLVELCEITRESPFRAVNELNCHLKEFNKVRLIRGLPKSIGNSVLIIADSILSIFTLNEISKTLIVTAGVMGKQVLGGIRGALLGVGIGLLYNIPFVILPKIIGEAGKFAFNFLEPLVNIGLLPVKAIGFMCLSFLTPDKRDAIKDKLNGYYDSISQGLSNIKGRFVDRDFSLKDAKAILMGGIAFTGLSKLGVETVRVGFIVSPFMLHFLKEISRPIGVVGLTYFGIRCAEYFTKENENKANFKKQTLKEFYKDIKRICDFSFVVGLVGDGIRSMNKIPPVEKVLNRIKPGKEYIEEYVFTMTNNIKQLPVVSPVLYTCQRVPQVLHDKVERAGNWLFP